MPVTSVSVGPGLRAWLDAGLTHILLDGTVAEFEAAMASESRPASVGTPAVSPNRNAQRPLSSDEARPPAKSSGRPLAAIGNTKAQDAKHITGAVSLSFASSEDLPRSPAAWPEPWNGWFAKIAPASVLWTYHELGADVTGIGRSQERSAFFRSLISELGLPKGSSVFWPSAMPTDESPLLHPNAALFASGLRLLMPRILVVFGDAALEDIGLGGKTTQFGQIMVEGKLLVLLPGIQELLDGQAQRSSTVSLLRALFSTISFG